MNENFSLERLWLLLRSDAAGGYRSLLVISGALAGVMFLTSMVALGDSDVAGGFYAGWFGTILFGWGIIASSRSFRELHDKTRNEAYLLLPASALEKTLARLLTVTVGFATYLLAFTTLTSVLVEGLNLLLFGERNDFFSPLDPLVWTLIPAYFFVQSFYFLGAAWFRKTHFVKTTLTGALAAIGLAAFSVVTVRILFAPYWGDIGDVGVAFEEIARSYGGVLEAIKTVAELGLPAACWIIAWLRVRETQVSDGV